MAVAPGFGGQRRPCSDLHASSNVRYSLMGRARGPALAAGEGADVAMDAGWCLRRVAMPWVGLLRAVAGSPAAAVWACGLGLPGRRTPPPSPPLPLPLPPPPHARPGTVARPQQEGRSVPASVPLQRGKTQTFPEACARAIAGLVWPGRGLYG